MLFTEKYYQQAQKETPSYYALRNLGLSTTAGEFPSIQPQNWMSFKKFGGIDRLEQLESG
jgi:hypothetical protein